jgi:hypothetical protein
MGCYLVAETSDVGGFSVAAGEERGLVTNVDAFATAADGARLADALGSAGFSDRWRSLDVVPVFRVPQREAVVDSLCKRLQFVFGAGHGPGRVEFIDFHFRWFILPEAQLDGFQYGLRHSIAPSILCRLPILMTRLFVGIDR